MGIEDFGGYGGHIGYVGMGWDGCERAWVGEVVLKLIWKVQGPLTQSQAFLTHCAVVTQINHVARRCTGSPSVQTANHVTWCQPWQQT